MTKILVSIDNTEILGVLEDNSVAIKLADMMPIVGVMKKYGDELYFVVSFDCFYESEVSEFEVGDVIYWKSKKSNKEAVAIFFGNTPVGDGAKPRSPSGAVKIGKLLNVSGLIDNFETGSIGRIEIN